MSKNAAVQYLLLSSALFISLVIRWTCTTVVFLSESELTVWYDPFRSSIGSSFVMKSFSNNLREPAVSWWVYRTLLHRLVFPGFRIVMIWETFHCPRKYPVLKTLLKIWVIALIPISGNSFKALPVIRSYPGAFFECNWFIAALTSFNLKFLIRVSSWAGVSRACRISCSSSSDISDVYGLKTFAKCSASTFAFCISLFAHSPSLLLSGGMDVWGCFNLLVASEAVKLSKYSCMAFRFSSFRRCLSSFTALLSFALTCGALVFCHCFHNLLLSRIFCLIIGVHACIHTYNISFRFINPS